MSRTEKLTAGLPIGHAVGLEIGALFTPIVPPTTRGIYYADHLSTDELRQKYAGDSAVNVNALVPVTYVCKNLSLLEAVGPTKFDYVIASHVIEHVPNPVQWLLDISLMLNPGGKLVLAIPDKRYTFDCNRELTSFADVVEAYVEKRMRPSFREIVEYIHGVADVPDSASLDDLWSGKINTDLVPVMHPAIISDFGDEWFKNHYEAIKNGMYMDVHCTVFTPDSFRRILKDLSKAGLFPYQTISFHDTADREMEFFITLQPTLGSTAG